MRRDNWVKSLGLDSDGTLFVEIDNGMRLFDLCLDTHLPAAVIIRPEDLMKPEYRQLYFRFLTTLKEIESVIINSIYDSERQFNNGDVVVDAGARIGAFAAKISAAVGEEGKIVAIEPEARNFACLQKNIEKNNLRNVIAVQKALWSQTQPLVLYLSGNASAHSIHYDPFYGPTGASVNVEAESLDRILDRLGFASVDFIKMDIEGSEIEALKGMTKTLESQVQLAIAAYHPARGNLAHAAVVPQLEQMGFQTRFADGIVQATKTRNRVL